MKRKNLVRYLNGTTENALLLELAHLINCLRGIPLRLLTPGLVTY